MALTATESEIREAVARYVLNSHEAGEQITNEGIAEVVLLLGGDEARAFAVQQWLFSEHLLRPSNGYAGITEGVSDFGLQRLRAIAPARSWVDVLVPSPPSSLTPMSCRQAARVGNEINTGWPCVWLSPSSTALTRPGMTELAPGFMTGRLLADRFNATLAGASSTASSTALPITVEQCSVIYLTAASELTVEATR